MRAYIPKESVKWFNAFLEERHDIDVWLTPRLAKNAFANKKPNNLTLDKYKYFAEFKVNNFEVIKAIKTEIDAYGIKLQVLMNDVEKHLTEIKSIKNKRDSQTKQTYLDLKRKVVGKYASYKDVGVLYKIN